MSLIFSKLKIKPISAPVAIAVFKNSCFGQREPKGSGLPSCGIFRRSWEEAANAREDARALVATETGWWAGFSESLCHFKVEKVLNRQFWSEVRSVLGF